MRHAIRSLNNFISKKVKSKLCFNYFLKSIQFNVTNSNVSLFMTQCRRPTVFQIMNSVRLFYRNISKTYQIVRI